MIDDPVASQQRDAVQRLVFCTGKLYYDLIAAGERPSNVAIIRVEEISPWPREVGDVRGPVPERGRSRVGAGRAEEHGRVDVTCSRACARRSATVTTLRYIGRPERASPAEGHKPAHDEEQARIVKDALTYSPAGRRKTPAAR